MYYLCLVSTLQNMTTILSHPFCYLFSVTKKILNLLSSRKQTSSSRSSFGDNQLIDIMESLGGATKLDSILKAYKTSETKGFFHYEWFDHPDKVQNTELPPHDAFYSILRSYSPLETEFTDYVNLLKSGLTT